MKMPPADSRMTDYLLGRLPAADVESVREEIFASDEAWQQLAAAEEELIDRYARGDLDSARRALVEQRILSSEEGQRKLRTAQALLGLERAAQGRRRKWVAATGLAAAVTIVAAGLSLWRAPQSPTAEPARRVVVAATLIVPLMAERAESTVPTVKLPPLTDGDLRIEFRLGVAEPVASGVAKFLVRGGERSFPATIHGASAVVQLPRRDVHAGPCQIEIRTGGRLIAAGSVLFTE